MSLIVFRKLQHDCSVFRGPAGTASHSVAGVNACPGLKSCPSAFQGGTREIRYVRWVAAEVES